MKWCSLFLTTTALAQTIQIMMPDTMPARLIQWQSTPASVVFSHPGQIAGRIDMNLECFDGSVYLRAPFGILPITVFTGTVSLSLAGMVAELLLTSENFYNRATLPGGSYRLCVTVLDPVDSLEKLSHTVCKGFTVIGAQRLHLVAPLDTLEQYDSDQVVFVWEAMSASKLELHIELRIVELQWGQSPWYALMTSQPIARCSHQLFQQLRWSCTIGHKYFKSGKRYGWGIVAVESGGYLELLSNVGEFIVP